MNTNIDGVIYYDLKYSRDKRGWLCEIYKKELVPIEAPQVNVMQSAAATMRGSHVHREHSDLFFIAQGRGFVGMKDVRNSSPTFTNVLMLELSNGALLVPPGVVHGVFFPVQSLLVTIESLPYDPDEELKVDWKDPAFDIPWPPEATSFPYEEALSFAEFMKRIEPWQERWKP